MVGKSRQSRVDDSNQRLAHKKKSSISLTDIIGERYNNYVNPLSISNSKTKMNNTDTLNSENIKTFHNRPPSS